MADEYYGFSWIGFVQSKSLPFSSHEIISVALNDRRNLTQAMEWASNYLKANNWESGLRPLFRSDVSALEIAVHLVGTE